MTLNDLGTGKLDKLKDDSVAKFIDTLHDSCVNGMLKYHRDWYIFERFAKGNHWIVYNKTLNKIQSIPTDDGEIRRTVNKIRSQIRGVKNFVKRNQPRWEVHPDGNKQENYDEALQKNKLIQYIYDTRKFVLLLTNQIVSSLKYSIGIIEGGIINKEGQQYLAFWNDDPFDVFFDPTSPSKEACRFIIKVVSKPLTSINNQYKTKLSPDNKDASSQYKESLERERKGAEGDKGSKDLETILVKEFWFKVLDSSGKTTIRMIKIAGNKVLEAIETNYKRYPFFIYNPEIDGNCIYSDPWIKDLISLNKSLDKTVSQIETYIQRMNAGKYLIKQGVEVSSISDKGAEKVFYKGTVPPMPMAQPQVPTALFSFSDKLEGWIEELGGIREASLGRLPGSIQSGKAIEALQNADASTVAEPIENLEMMLAEIGEFCLEVIDQYQITSEEIVTGKEKIKYIGGSAKNPPSDALQIKPGRVTVKIVPEVAYSEDSRKEWVLRLAEAKLIDPQTVLEQFAFSNISDIVERMKIKEEEAYKQEMMKQQASHAGPGDGQPQDSAELADQENMKMASGQQVQPTPKALWLPEHTQLHMMFIQQNQDAYKQNQQLFDSHIQAESQYQ
jgi:hypothetical protein